jgi:hypothetical protein
MSALSLSAEELAQLCRACCHIRLGPDFPLREFLAARLTHSNPDLAAKVAEFDPNGWEALEGFLRVQQGWGRE